MAEHCGVRCWLLSIGTMCHPRKVLNSQMLLWIFVLSTLTVCNESINFVCHFIFSDSSIKCNAISIEYLARHLRWCHASIVTTPNWRYIIIWDPFLLLPGAHLSLIPCFEIKLLKLDKLKLNIRHKLYSHQ